jgi:cyclic pyranopterin phosphate synthase
MPPEGIENKSHDRILGFEEIMRLCGIMAGMGIRKIKVTGGEPLVRRRAASLIKSLKTLEGIEEVTLTTNGLLLGKYLDEADSDPASLADAINISLDALNPKRFRRITGQTGGETPGPPEITGFAERLLERGRPVKINALVIRGLNEEDIIPLASLARDRNLAVRFIELMPLGAASAYRPVPGEEIAALLKKTFGTLTPFSGSLGNGPAVYYTLPGFIGKIGFISALSRNFCKTCNRLRLSSEGFLRVCLSSGVGKDLSAPLRSGASDGELAAAISRAVALKPRCHTLPAVCSGAPTEPREEHRSGMFSIGG